MGQSETRQLADGSGVEAHKVRGNRHQLARALAHLKLSE